MSPERESSPEARRHERFCLRDMPLDVSNRFQAELAATTYGRHNGVNSSEAPHNTVMLWWITKGFARAYGDYVVAHELDEIDVADELCKEDILEALEADVTVH